MRTMRIAHYYALGLSHESGVTSAIRSWSSAQASAGHSTEVLTACGSVDSDYYGRATKTIRHLGSTRATLIPNIWQLRDSLRAIDLLYLHEGWTLSNYVAATIATALGKPYVVMPHGVYEPQIVTSLRRPRYIRSLLEGALLKHAAAAHIFFASEAPHVRRISPMVRTFVAPTGFDTPHLSSGDEVRDDFALWFGRFEPYHKGLDILLRAVSLLEPSARPRIRLFGYDYRGGIASVRSLIDSLDLSGNVSVEPPLWGEQKASVLASARAYLHPARWECHSVALLEALAAGAPAFVSDRIHIAETLRRTGTATAVASSPEAWAEVLRLIAAGPLPAAKRKELFDELSWTRAIDQMNRGLNCAMANGKIRAPKPR